MDKIKISVRALVEYALRAGDLNLEFRLSARSHEGIFAHQRIQKSRPANYQSEVTTKHTIETESFDLTISGRIDGVYTNVSPVIIEEIKTTRGDLDKLVHSNDIVHWGQLKSYAYLYSIENALDNIATQLVYYNIESKEEKIVYKEFSVDDLKSFFSDLVDRYVYWARKVTSWVISRNTSIRDLSFPYATYRPGQRHIAVEVYRCIRDSKQLLIQAPTGIGKTIAVLFPAIKALSENCTSKVFYLTARTTGRIAAESALGIMRKNYLNIKSLTLTAKDKICFNPEKSCTPDECEYAKGYFDRLNEALDSAFSRDTWNRTTVERIALQFNICPFELSLELSLWADCIIADYNYAFDPRVYLKRFFDENSSDYAFIVDEAHNLVDRSREMFSATIYKKPFLELRRNVKKTIPTVYKALGKLNYKMAKMKHLCSETEDTHIEKNSPEDLVSFLSAFVKHTEKWLLLNKSADFKEQLLERYFEALNFLRTAEDFDQSYASILERMDSDLKVKLFCIDPSSQLNMALKRSSSTIFLSATLTPVNYFNRIFGCDDDSLQLKLPSPFPKDNFNACMYTKASTLYRMRKHSKKKIAGIIHGLVQHKIGNYFAFFPSYAYMKMIADEFTKISNNTRVIIQSPQMTEQEKEVFLDQFGDNNQSTTIGFVVLGGIFGEGIDLVGERLCAAAIVGVGLPAICPERELIRRFFQDAMDQGFEYAYLYPGMNRVLQAAGRVIRSEKDKGIVMLIDQRYSMYRYKSLLPPDWEVKKIHNLGYLSKQLESFWTDSN